MEFYGRTSVMRKTFSYIYQIEEFPASLRLTGGSSPLVASHHRDECSGCEWTFTVEATSSDEERQETTTFENDMLYAFHDNYVFHLGRKCSSGVEGAYVEVRLSIVDCFGRSSPLANRTAYFRDPRRFNAIASIEKNYFSFWNKLLYLPNDTLTLKWEITTYECYEKSYDKKEEFQNSSKSRLSFLEVLLCSLFILAVAVICPKNFFQEAAIPFLEAVAFCISFMFAVAVTGITVLISERSNTINQEPSKDHAGLEWYIPNPTIRRKVKKSFKRPPTFLTAGADTDFHFGRGHGQNLGLS